MSELPPGFVLDEASPPPLPDGFALDAAPRPLSNGQRFMTGLGDIAQGVRQLGAHTLGTADPQAVDQQIAAREQEYQARRRAGGDTGTDWWRIGGNSVGMLPAAAALPAGAGLVGAAGLGAAGGAALSLAEPVTSGGDYWAQKSSQALTGGAVGAATGPIGHAIGRAIAPVVTEPVRQLRREGVDLTIGQIRGGNARRFEDAATSLPVAGDRILAAQRQSLESFNRAAANRVLEPLGQRVARDAPVGRELISDVGQRVSQAYDDAIAQANPFAVDRQLGQDLLAVATRHIQTPEAQRTFLARLQNDVASRMQNGQITPETYQTVRSELGRLARQYQASNSASDRELAEAFLGARTAFDDLLARTNPQVAPQMQAANTAYANLVRLEGAAGMQGAVEGVFSGPQLAAAVRSGDRSLRHREYARGDALMQDLSDAGRRVLPSTVNDSGTATRTSILNPLAWAAGALVSPLYSRPAQRTMGWFAAHEAPQPLGLLGNAVSRPALALSSRPFLIPRPENASQDTAQ